MFLGRHLYQYPTKVSNMALYVLRVDDVWEGHYDEKFIKFVSLCEKHRVKALLGVIPLNRDPVLAYRKTKMKRDIFFKKIKMLQDKGFFIGLHGYKHELLFNSGGVLNMCRQSEFAGDSYKNQAKKIAAGLKIFNEYKLHADCFIAPNHSYDLDTIEALKQNGLSVISDGISLFPYIKNGVTFIPVILDKPRRIPFGLITVCMHLDKFTNSMFQCLDDFLSFEKKNIIDFNKSYRFAHSTYYKYLNLLTNPPLRLIHRAYLNTPKFLIRR